MLLSRIELLDKKTVLKESMLKKVYIAVRAGRSNM